LFNKTVTNGLTGLGIPACLPSVGKPAGREPMVGNKGDWTSKRNEQEKREMKKRCKKSSLIWCGSGGGE